MKEMVIFKITFYFRQWRETGDSGVEGVEEGVDHGGGDQSHKTDPDPQITWRLQVLLRSKLKTRETKDVIQFQYMTPRSLRIIILVREEGGIEEGQTTGEGDQEKEDTHPNGDQDLHPFKTEVIGKATDVAITEVSALAVVAEMKDK